MAISGSINIEGLEITGSYTNINSFSYKKKSSGIYNITYNYSIYVNEEHRNNSLIPLHKSFNTVNFNTTGSVDPFYWSYQHLKSQPYFISSSLIDC